MNKIVISITLITSQNSNKQFVNVTSVNGANLITCQGTKLPATDKNNLFLNGNFQQHPTNVTPLKLLTRCKNQNDNHKAFFPGLPCPSTARQNQKQAINLPQWKCSLVSHNGHIHPSLKCASQGDQKPLNVCNPQPLSWLSSGFAYFYEYSIFPQLFIPLREEEESHPSALTYGSFPTRNAQPCVINSRC